MQSVRKQTKKDKPVEESWTEDVMERFNKRPLTKALLLMHKTHGANPKITKQQLQVRNVFYNYLYGEEGHLPKVYRQRACNIPVSLKNFQLLLLLIFAGMF